MSECPFCNVESSRIVAEEGPCVAIEDGFPVSNGHTLIIPKRHISSFREMTTEEWETVHRLANAVAHQLQQDDPSIQGFNLGINDGADAGQTVPHAHVHLIPRRHGDVENPRGGVRHVIPCKGYYPDSKEKR